VIVTASVNDWMCFAMKPPALRENWNFGTVERRTTRRTRKMCTKPPVAFLLQIGP
jgi:hypothetical protein